MNKHIELSPKCKLVLRTRSVDWGINIAKYGQKRVNRSTGSLQTGGDGEGVSWARVRLGGGGRCPEILARANIRTDGAPVLGQFPVFRCLIHGTRTSIPGMSMRGEKSPVKEQKAPGRCRELYDTFPRLKPHRTLRWSQIIGLMETGKRHRNQTLKVARL